MYVWPDITQQFHPLASEISHQQGDTSKIAAGPFGFHVGPVARGGRREARRLRLIPLA
jgi:hypothetical protein